MKGKKIVTLTDKIPAGAPVPGEGTSWVAALLVGPDIATLFTDERGMYEAFLKKCLFLRWDLGCDVSGVLEGKPCSYYCSLAKARIKL